MWHGGRISFSYSFYNIRIRKLTGLSNLLRHQHPHSLLLTNQVIIVERSPYFRVSNFAPTKVMHALLLSQNLTSFLASLPEAGETLFRFRERRRDTKGGRLILSESTAHQG